MNRNQLEEILTKFEYPIEELKLKGECFYYEFETQWEAEEMIDLLTGNPGLNLEMEIGETFLVYLEISNEEEDEFLLL